MSKSISRKICEINFTKYSLIQFHEKINQKISPEGLFVKSTVFQSIDGLNPL